MRYVDERDTIFARMALCEGTPLYTQYYARHPEREEPDSLLRRMPAKGIFGQTRPGPDGRSVSDEELAVHSIARGNTALIGACRQIVEDADFGDRRITVPPEQITPVVKEVARYYGADLVGTLEMQDHHFYTHHGFAATGDYARPVDKSLPYAIVLAVETDKDMINRAPHAEQMLATRKGYTDVALVGCKLSLCLKALGWGVFLNTVAYYNAPLVGLAADAGLGQIGRHTMLITRQYGPRVRLGAVMTDLPLLSDKPVDFGLVEFCRRCGKCAGNCPGKAISPGQPDDDDGRPRWGLVEANCMQTWKRVGTDCGICLSSCPFSQGMDPDRFDRIKADPAVIDRILADYDRQYGKRPYIEHKLAIAQL